MTRETKFVLGVIAGAMALVVSTSLLAPREDSSDRRPSTHNAGPYGAKATYVLLGRLGYRVSRYNGTMADLAKTDAAHETLVMANPWGGMSESEQKALAQFINAGGRVLGTGASGMQNLPGFYWENEPAKFGECKTTPEGTSPLAAVGPLEMHPYTVAKVDLVETEVAQRCRDVAVVMEYGWGKGHVVWWAEPAPLTNRGLHEDVNLTLLLASIGGRERAVLFDETNDEYAPSRGLWDGADGLPLKALAWQLLLGVVLLLLSFSRRHGPRRALTTTPRTSPLEFAYSMGNLYLRGKAGVAAAAEARARLLRVMEQQCGLPRDVTLAGAETIADELRVRLNYRNDELVRLLERTEATQGIGPAEALTLVRKLNEIAQQLRAAVSRLQRRSFEEMTVG